MSRTGGHRWIAAAGLSPALLVLLALPALVRCQSVREGVDWQDAHGATDLSPDVANYLTWLPMPNVPTTKTLFDLWGQEEGDLWAVGEDGLVLHTDGLAWEEVPVPTGVGLRALTGFGRRDLYAVGEQGVVLHYHAPPTDQEPGGESSDPRWEIESTPTEEDLLAVWGCDTDDVWAVGTDGIVLHRTVEGWEMVETGFYDRLAALTGFGCDAVVAVGDFGTVLRWDGESWLRDPDTGTSRNLDGVWGTRMEELLAVGLGGLALRYHDGLWTRIETESAAYLRDVWGRSWREVYAVGWDGTILRFQDDAPTRIVGREAHRLEAAFGGAGRHTYFVGSEGLVLEGPQPPPHEPLPPME